MSTSDPKKLAKNHFESFKKLYNNVCNTTDLTAWEESTKVLNDYWLNSLLPVNVKREIAKLFENESLELKLVLNFMHSFGVPIPQKKWFLGSAHSRALQARPPCNAPMLYFDRFENGCLVTKYQFHSELVPETSDPKWSISMDNESCFVWMTNRDENAQGRVHCNFKTGLTFELAKPDDPDQNATRDRLIFGTHCIWNEKELELNEEGKLHIGEEEVIIFLDGEKITTEPLVQYDVRDSVDGQVVTLLFESFFLASGTIREGKSGYLIECQEVPGSYPTTVFVLSPDAKHIFRMGSVIGHQRLLPVRTNHKCPNVSRWNKARNELHIFQKKFGAFFSHERVQWIAERHGEEFETRRQENVDMICRDMETLSVAVTGKNVDLSMSVLENIIANTLRKPETTKANRLADQPRCGCANEVCQYIWDINMVMNIGSVQFDYRLVDKKYFPMFLNTMTHIVEMILKLFRDREDCPLWEREKEKRKANENKTPKYYSSVSLFSLDIYQKCNEPENLGLTMDTASRTTLDKYFRGEEHIGSVTELLLQRPDIMLFDPRPLLPPISLIKKFCELYPKLGTTEVDLVELEQSMIKEFDKWSIKETPKENRPKSKSKGGKSSKK